MTIIHDQTLSNQSYIISNRRHYSNNTLSLMSITEQNSIKLNAKRDSTTSFHALTLPENGNNEFIKETRAGTEALYSLDIPSSH